MTAILQVAVPAPMHRTFDYLPPAGIDPQTLKPGMRVEVPFGRHRKVGILLRVAATSALPLEKLRPAASILDNNPLLGASDLKLLNWASRYYHHPIGEVMASALTVLLRKGESAAPASVRRLILTPGTADPADRLARAPRQAELLDLLRQNPSGLAREDLTGANSDLSASARALIGKGLAEWGTVTADPVAAPPVTPAIEPPRLNPAQAEAVAAVTQSLGGYRAFLLEGVTGSGKTEIYLRLTEEVLARGQQVMLLLPEINLTPQLEARFRQRFAAPLAVLHSALADSERRRAWLAVQRGEAAILLGTRSAAFTPAPRLGLIILDEEHDSSFKQQEGFRFSARDVAVMRASLSRTPIVLGSATPSLESLHNVQQGRYALLELPYRAGNSAAPRFKVLDIRAQRLEEGISAQLRGRITETLARGEQALIFVNRRGYAPTLICHDCGWVAPCRYCDTRLVIHARAARLRCHHCGFEQPVPRQCPDCGKSDLRPLGLGTERVEAALKQLFPAARAVRLDRDSTRRKGSLEKLLDDIRDGRADILIGTQMLAKGHHFPGVTLVGILDVDAGLFSTDFRAGERTAQLILQVAGRAGREEKPGTVILQTRHPDHPLIGSLVRSGYPAVARACLAERQAAGMPPFGHQALWRADAPDSETAREFLEILAGLARGQAVPTLQVLGPAPAPLGRKGNRHRWQLLLQARQRAPMHALLQQLMAAVPDLPLARKVRWSLDVDPIDLY